VKKNPVGLLFLFLFCISSLASGEEFSAKVIEVLDGDTVLIVRSGGLLKVRLAEIDAPEKAQAFGKDSKRSLVDMVKGKQVRFISRTVDQYGRLVAFLDIDGLEVNAEQIRRGLAWEYSNYHSNKVLIDLQEEAKKESRGMWAQDKPIPPWKWRKLHPIVTATSLQTTRLTGFNCGKKKYCSEMTSCEEAKFYLSQCKIKSLDGDGNGIPCENLCLPDKMIKN